MVLPTDHPHQIALFIIARPPPSSEWLRSIVEVAENSAEVRGIRLTVMGADDGSFAEWTLQQLGNYVANNYIRPENPFASCAFAAVDESSERSNSVLVVSLDRKSFGRVGEARIAGTVRVGPEYAVDIPAVLHGDVRGILHYSEAADATEDGIVRLGPPPPLSDGEQVWFTQILRQDTAVATESR